MSEYRIDTKTLFDHHPLVKEILCRLHNAGHEAVLIGGAVRDGVLSLIGSSSDFPPEDVDIATSALPSEVRSILSDHQIIGVGEEFGVLVVVSGEQEYEVATYRVEGEYDGRWPGKVDLVRDLKGDVFRRDLTINGLAADERGKVIDLVGGVDDLIAGCIRAIGDPRARFSEDLLRMLRAVRFSCQIGAKIEKETASAIRDNASKITGISWERIRDEVFRILQMPRSSQAITSLDEYGLLDAILPELVDTKGAPQPEEYHPEGDVYVHTILALQVADGFVADPVVKLAVLLHDIGKPYALERSGGENMGGHCAVGARMAEDIGQRLRLSNRETRRLAYLVKNHMRIADLPKMGRGKQVRFVSKGEILDETALANRYPLFFDLLRVLVADCEASAHRSSGWSPIIEETLQVVAHIDKVCDLRRAREIIDGNTLIDLGMNPGPELGRVLEDLHDRIIAGEIETAHKARATAKKLISKHNIQEK